MRHTLVAERATRTLTGHHWWPGRGTRSQSRPGVEERERDLVVGDDEILGGPGDDVIIGDDALIVASFVLALSRAVGETMAVTLAAGSTPRLTANPLESIQTMTAYIVQMSLGDVQHGDIEYQTIFAVAALLFVITLLSNVVAHRILRRFREVYE